MFLKGEKTKKRKLLASISMLLCAAFIVVPPIQVMAEELTDEEPIYYDTEEGRFVNDIDEYLSQLNDGVITSYAPILEDHESETAPYGAVSPPSKDCSNIFGHSWGDWGSWEEFDTMHRPSGPCILVMKRWRSCGRTYCGANQSETETVFITSCHGG